MKNTLKEKAISNRRLHYLEGKIDRFLHTCLRPNETVTLNIQLHDRNVSLTQEGKAGYNDSIKIRYP